MRAYTRAREYYSHVPSNVRFRGYYRYASTLDEKQIKNRIRVQSSTSIRVDINDYLIICCIMKETVVTCVLIIFGLCRFMENKTKRSERIFLHCIIAKLWYQEIVCMFTNVCHFRRGPQTTPYQTRLLLITSPSLTNDGMSPGPPNHSFFPDIWPCQEEWRKEHITPLPSFLSWFCGQGVRVFPSVVYPDWSGNPCGKYCYFRWTKTRTRERWGWVECSFPSWNSGT